MEHSATMMLTVLATRAQMALEAISCQGRTGRVNIRYPSSPRSPR